VRRFLLHPAADGGDRAVALVKRQSAAYVVGGVGLGVGLALALAAIIHPRGADLLDLINGWNGRHPDQQFNLGHQSGVRGSP